MEKEFIIDQEDVVVVPVDINEEKEEIVDFDYSSISDNDFTSAEESDIDWSTL